MELFLVTFFVLTLAVAGMAVGVMFGRSPIAGSCGGLNAVNGSGACQSCSRPCKTRRTAEARSMADNEASAATAMAAQPINKLNDMTGKR